MSNAYNIYCDESCHLEKDGQKVMVLGAVWCSADKVKEISQRINEIKIRNGMTKQFEIKWTKVSPGGLQLYTDIVNYFFDDDDLHFRAVVADKTILDHQAHSQTHDEWYYKMYFELLNKILDPENKYCIYLDVKDTQGREKIQKLQESKTDIPEDDTTLKTELKTDLFSLPVWVRVIIALFVLIMAFLGFKSLRKRKNNNLRQ